LSTILVTGAQGLLGRYFVDAQLKRDASVTVVGIGRSEPRATAFGHEITLGTRSVKAPVPIFLLETGRSARYRYHSLDVCHTDSLSALLAEVRPTAILHLASGLRDDPTEHLFRTNVLGTESLYEAVSRAALTPCRIVVVTSGSVYGPVGDEWIPLSENAPVAPFDAYSISKYAQERLALALAKQKRIPTVIARVFNVVAPGQDERHLCGKLGSRLAAIEAGVVEPRMLLESVTTTRDFVDARDVSRYLAELLADGKPGETYNVATGVETRIDSVVEQFISLARIARLQTEQKPPRAVDMPRNVAAVSKLVRLAGRPGIPLSKSLSDVLDYYRWCHETLGNA
jgi:nucleoside-diphosphate-sugar epimerase